jgi:hypothetical protein
MNLAWPSASACNSYRLHAHDARPLRRPQPGRHYQRTQCPTHPPGRYHSVVPRFVNSVSRQSTGVLKFNSLRANFEA